MTLVTTPGDANADSYVTTDAADAYFAARGITAWTGDTTAKENALRRATGYLDNQYRGRWIGIRTNINQSLGWPRADGTRDQYHATYLYALMDIDGVLIDVNSVPVQVQTAAIEAALLALTGAVLEPTLARGGQIKSISKGVGPLNKSITYADGAPAVDRYLVIEGLLRGLVTSTPGASSSMVSMVRA